jgi:hypothetical protein
MRSTPQSGHLYSSVIFPFLVSSLSRDAASRVRRERAASQSLREAAALRAFFDSHALFNTILLTTGWARSQTMPHIVKHPLSIRPTVRFFSYY